MRVIGYICRVVILLTISLGVLAGCVILRPATVTVKNDIKQYTRAYIPATQAIHSSNAVTISGIVIPYSRSVNPRDVIAGILSKRGYIVMDQLDDRFRQETMIVNYGESGKRKAVLGYTIEVTLQFISAETGELLCVTTAEGCGDTEADDIKQAVTRALDALFE